jgi:hypothetical protein
VFVNDRPLCLAAYSPVSMRRREQALRQTARFFAHGMDAYFITVPAIAFTDWAFFHDTPFWVGDRIADEPLAPASGSMDEQADHILRGDPGAFLIVRFGLHEPKTWRDLHPEELVVTETGERLPVPSMASDLYWDCAARCAAAMIRHCEARPWAHRIIGYADFLRMEGTHEPMIERWLFDHGPAMTARWRSFLAARHPGRDVSRTAVPCDRLRGAQMNVSRLLYWQNEEENRDLRDYLELLRDLFHAGFRRVGEAMAAAAPADRFFVHDALKQPMLGWDNLGFFDAACSWPHAYPELTAGSGHVNVTRLCDARGFDGLITPHDYQARGLGGIFEPEGAADSMVLRGKLFLCEMDTRTAAGRDVCSPAQTPREFAALTWRNMASALTRGFWPYWMDVHEDWFSDDVHPVIARQREVLRQAAEWPHETPAGIAVILDDEAVLETNGDGRFFNEAIMWDTKMGLARCGVPYRLYLFDDLSLDEFPEHRVFYFPNLFRVSEERLAVLREKVFGGGRVVLWGPGSGISDGRRRGPDSASRLTGFSFDWLEANYPRRVLVTDFAHPLTAEMDEGAILGGPLAYGPVLLPTDGRPLGSAWTKQGRNAAGLAVKEMNGWLSVFTTAIPIPAALWRGCARAAGAHVYADSHDVLMADSSVVAMHSIRSGRKRIRLPRAGRVTDVIADRETAARADAIEFDLDAPDTRVFRVAL